MTAADINGDGMIDLVVVNSTYLGVLLNTTAPGQRPRSRLSLPKLLSHEAQGPFSVAVADFNGDGKPDLSDIIPNLPPYSATAYDIGVLLNTTRRRCGTHLHAPSYFFWWRQTASVLAVGDVNGDGKADLAATVYRSSVAVLLNLTAPGSTTPAFLAKTDFPVNSPQGIAVGDFNDDGRLDLVSTTPGTSNPGTQIVSVFLNQAATTNRATATGTIIDNVSVTVNQSTAQADPSNASQIHFTAVFSEPVAGFSTAGVAYGGTANPSSDTVTGSGTTYDVAISGMTSDGSVTVSVNAGAAQDAFGNLNTASTSTDNSVTYDGFPPTVTINQASAQADPSDASAIHFTAVFNEPVTGFKREWSRIWR